MKPLLDHHKLARQDWLKRTSRMVTRWIRERDSRRYAQVDYDKATAYFQRFFKG